MNNTGANWLRLESSPPSGAHLAARLAAPDICSRLLCAIDSSLQRHFLVVLEPDDEPYSDRQSRGLTAETKDLMLDGSKSLRYLDIACNDASGHSLFDIIGAELVEGLTAASQGSSVQVVRRVLGKWRRFWGQLPTRSLSYEEQLGLFGELWFLTFWLAAKIGYSDAVQRWRGPFSARHDFEWSGVSVEAKTTTSTRGRTHKINGIDQLALPERGKLFLFSLRLREETNATYTLPSLVSLCRTGLGTDQDGISYFENALTQAGYSIAHEDIYSKLSFRVVQQGLFDVRDDFPRLTRTLFPKIPDSIESIEYVINISGCGHLLVAESVDQFAGV